MKIFLILFLFCNLFALNIEVNSGKENNNIYSVMNLYNDYPFRCERNENKVLCFFDKNPVVISSKVSSLYFDIVPFYRGERFVIKIIPHMNFKLFSFKDEFVNYNVSDYKVRKKAKKWVIIAFERKIPYLKNQKTKGLKFPIKVENKLPFIGAIGLNGELIDINAQTEDIKDYFSIVKEFKSLKDVDGTLIDINNFIEKYPNSIFMPEVLYMKLKILDSLEGDHSDDIISIGKEWIKKYSTNDKLPEVLLILAKTYSKIGFLTDATYFYNRIFTEYPDTKYYYLAKIYLADQLYINGESKKAFKLYNDVLVHTQDINIASLAAYRLADRYMQNGKLDKSFKLYEKIFNSNKEYILKDKQKAFTLAKKLASYNGYELAIKIGESLIKRLNKLDDIYEELLYDLALWSYENKEYKKSLMYVQKYEKEFPYGDYSDDIVKLQDKLLFEISDKNTTKALNQYDEIIKKYGDEYLGQKALYQKAMLLFKLKKYEEIYKMKNKLLDIDDKIFKNKDEFFKKLDKALALEYLNNKECMKFVEFIKDKKITFSKKYDDKLYQCFVDTREFEKASIICNKYLLSTDDKIALKWTIRKEKVEYYLENYDAVVKLVSDICNLTKNCQKYLYDKFFALYKLKRYDEMLEVAKQLQKHKNVRNLDVFFDVVKYAKQEGLDLLALEYSLKILDYEKFYKINTYSPYIDFLAVKYAKKANKINLAISILKDLINKKIDDENKARALYELSSLTNKKSYLNQCIRLKNSKVWKPLCKDALSLY